MQRQVPELAPGHHHVHAGLGDLLDLLLELRLLAAAEGLQLLRRLDQHCAFGLCLQGVNGAGEDGDLAFVLLDDGRFCLAFEHHSVDHLTVVKAAAQNLAHPDIVHVELSLLVGKNTDASLSDQIREEVLVAVLFGHHSCPDRLLDGLLVSRVGHFEARKCW